MNTYIDIYSYIEVLYNQIYFIILNSYLLFKNKKSFYFLFLLCYSSLFYVDISLWSVSFYSSLNNFFSHFLTDMSMGNKFFQFLFERIFLQFEGYFYKVHTEFLTFFFSLSIFKYFTSLSCLHHFWGEIWLNSLLLYMYSIYLICLLPGFILYLWFYIIWILYV